MASAGNEDLFCPVCKEFFEWPLSLRCGHVFCEKCLEGTIDRAQRVWEHDKPTPEFSDFPCPVCNCKCLVPERLYYEVLREKYPINWPLKRMADKAEEQRLISGKTRTTYSMDARQERQGVLTAAKRDNDIHQTKKRFATAGLKDDTDDDDYDVKRPKKYSDFQNVTPCNYGETAVDTRSEVASSYHGTTSGRGEPIYYPGGGGHVQAQAQPQKSMQDSSSGGFPFDLNSVESDDLLNATGQAGPHTEFNLPIPGIMADSPHGGRTLLKPWLVWKINSGAIQGLRWINQNERIFRISWKYGGKNNWNSDDGTIFKDWAVHTGRYREGINKQDYPLWKTRLRCAFTKSKEIQELKTMSKLDDTYDPYKVFQFSKKSTKSYAPHNEQPGFSSNDSSLEDKDDQSPGSSSGGFHFDLYSVESDDLLNATGQAGQHTEFNSPIPDL